MFSQRFKLSIMAITAVFFSALILIISQGGIFTSWGIDWQWKLNGPKKPDMTNQILIVGIDNTTLQKYRGNKPRLDRRFYATLIDRLASMGARLIGFDIMFDTPGDPEEDKALEESVKRYGRVVSNCSLFFDESFTNLWITGRSFFHKHCIGEGFANFPLDSDGFIRRARLFAPKGDIPVRISFSLALYLADIGRKPEEISYHKSYMFVPRPEGFSPMKIDLDHKGRTLIPFIPKASIHTVPPSTIFDAPPDSDLARDKIVLVGGTADEFRDSFHTPFSPRGDMPGVEIHAHFLESLLGYHTMYEISGPIWWISLCIISLASALIVGKLGAMRGFIALAVISVILQPITAMLFRHGTYVNIFDVWTVIFIGWISAVTVSAIFLRQEKNNLSKIFRKYLSPTLIDELLKHPESLALGGAKKEAVVLFADVRGFTRICEDRPPEQIINILNTYFSAVTKVIFEKGGVLDKYIGDGLMAFFGLPISTGNEAVRAVEAALGMQEALRKILSEHPSPNDFPITKIGIGIHGGTVVVGNVGSELHQEYTLLGDTVNVAARLESLSQEGQIIVSSYIKERIPQNRFKINSLGCKAIKGRKSEIEVYEILQLDDQFKN